MAMKPGTYDAKAKGHGSSYMSMQAVKLGALLMRCSTVCQN